MVWAQGQMKWAKVAKTSSIYDVNHKKQAPLNHINFFLIFLNFFLN